MSDRHRVNRDPPEAVIEAPPEPDLDPGAVAGGDEPAHDATAASDDPGPEPEGWVLL